MQSSSQVFECRAVPVVPPKSQNQKLPFHAYMLRTLFLIVLRAKQNVRKKIIRSLANGNEFSQFYLNLGKLDAL
jgi:hypothetical protein